MAAPILARTLFVRGHLQKPKKVRNFLKITGFQVGGSIKIHNSLKRLRCSAILRDDTTRKTFCTAATLKCWKCTKERQDQLFVCEHCGSVQTVDYNMDYFKVFSLEPSFSIDNRELTKRFRVLQTQFHPDKFVSKMQQEQDLSVECSSFINTVYQTLAQPLQRGQYLLRLNNEEIAESSTEMDIEFLTEIMEKNEILVGEISPKELEAINLDNKVVMKNMLEELSEAFDSSNLKKAKMLLAKLKYYVNIDEKIKLLTVKHSSKNATEGM